MYVVTTLLLISWVDSPAGHYHAWKDGRVLHRDLSEDNLMVYSVDNAKKVKGVVNDWDMSSKLGEDGNVIRSAAVHRTGTAPFMARDLLQEGVAWPHFYRHDMESLFYILVWAAVHYSLENEEQNRTKINSGKIHPELSQWMGEHRESYKVMFLLDDDKKDSIFSHIGKEFKDVKEEWLEPLWNLFNNAYSKKLKWNPHDTTHDYATYDGKLTFETFMAAMGVTPRGNSVVV